MDIPDFRRGEQLTARKLNQLGNEIRLARLLSGPGYTLTQTPGGTVLNIQPQFTVGGGGTAPAAVCPFEVTDVSEPGGGGQLTLKVEIAYGLVQNRIPDGMVLGTPYILEGVQDSNFYVYCVLEYDPATLQLRPESNAISFMVDQDLLPNGETTEYVVVAIVQVETTGGPADGPYIKEIQSTCQPIVPNPCSLAWEA